MSKINLWNTISQVTTGRIRLLGSGQQLFGTVVNHGVNNKTITVRVSAKTLNATYKRWIYSHKNKQVHDQLNYCITGDRIIIANCNKLSSTKAYYVKSIVVPAGRPMAPKNDPQPIKQERTLSEYQNHPGSNNVIKTEKKKSRKKLRQEERRAKRVKKIQDTQKKEQEKILKSETKKQRKQKNLQQKAVEDKQQVSGSEAVTILKTKKSDRLV